MLGLADLTQAVRCTHAIAAGGAPAIGRSANARSLLLQRGKTLIGRVAHVVLVPSTLLGPAYIKVVEASALLLRAAGLRVDVESSLDRVIARHGVRPAAVALDTRAERIAEPRSALRGPSRELSRR